MIGHNIRGCCQYHLWSPANNIMLLWTLLQTKKRKYIGKHLLRSFNTSHPYSHLMLACGKYGHGNIELVKYLVKIGGNVHGIHGDILQEACKYGHMHLAKYLIKCGADIHACVLSVTIENGHLRLLKFLYHCGADIYHTHVYWRACCRGQLPIIKYLLHKGVDIHSDNDIIIQMVKLCGYLHILKYLNRRGISIDINMDDTLKGACSKGQLNVVRYCLRKGANIHADNDQSLRNAIDNKHYHIVEYLLKRGANRDVIQHRIAELKRENASLFSLSAYLRII